MKIALLASEGAPYIKSGGLGDVMEALPAALGRIEGNEVALLLPYYKKIRENKALDVGQVTSFEITLGWRKQYVGVMKLNNAPKGVQVYFVDNLYYFGNWTAESTVTAMTASALPTSPRPVWKSF